MNTEHMDALVQLELLWVLKTTDPREKDYVRECMVAMSKPRDLLFGLSTLKLNDPGRSIT